MQPFTCVRCPGVKMRLRSRELIKVYRVVQVAEDAALDAQIWVCPECRRIELRWPEDVALPEEELNDEEKYLQLLHGMSEKELLSIAGSELRSEGIRAAARKLLRGKAD